MGRLLHAILRPRNYQVGANSLQPGRTGAYTASVITRSEDVTGCSLAWATTGITTAQRISTSDCYASGFYADAVLIVLRAGQTVTISQRSTAFDAYLGLGRLSSGAVVAENDDGGGGTDSQITYTSPTEDVFVIVATTFFSGRTGPYQLIIQ